MTFKSPLTEEELEEKKSLIRDFYSQRLDKYYILEWSRFDIKRLFHRHTAGDFYHININDTLEDKVIECLKNYGKIYDIKLVGDQVIFTLGTYFNQIIFKLYSIDDDTCEVK